MITLADDLENIEKEIQSFEAVNYAREKIREQLMREAGKIPGPKRRGATIRVVDGSDLHKDSATVTSSGTSQSVNYNGGTYGLTSSTEPREFHPDPKDPFGKERKIKDGLSKVAMLARNGADDRKFKSICPTKKVNKEEKEFMNNVLNIADDPLDDDLSFLNNMIEGMDQKMSFIDEEDLEPIDIEEDEDMEDSDEPYPEDNGDLD